jgi:aryl-alcohol dehydrogenase-like predicted oxidoreductase
MDGAGGEGGSVMGGMASSFARLGIGTAQFGFAYGVTNRRGQVGPDEARRILALADASGLEVIDTAPAYGDAEALLGRLDDVARDFRIVTKTPLLGPERIMPEHADSVAAALDASRRALHRDCLDAVLVHHGAALLLPGAERVIGILRAAKAEGAVARIGCSVYDPDELDAVLAVFAPDIVQLPFSLLDQRFARAGALARLKAQGVEIHARSIFLQGALLASPDTLPAALDRARPALERVRQFLAAHGLDPLSAALGHALAEPSLDCLILGVTGADELQAIIAAVRALPPRLPDFTPLAVDDPAIVSPARWRLPDAGVAL